MGLSISLGVDLTRFTRGMQQISSQLQQTAKQMEVWGSKMQDIGGKLSLGITAPLSLAGGSALKMAADMEQAAISFEVLTKSAESGKRVLGDLQKFAADTPFEFPELREGAQQLLAYGFQVEQLTPLLRKAGDLASGMTVPITEVTRVLGRLKAGDFGDAFERLRDFGISRPDLEGEGLKFDKSGSYKGSVADALTAVTKIIDTKFKGMTEKQSQSARGLFATATDSVGMFATDIGNKLIEAFDLKGKLKGFIAGMESLQKGFNELSPGMQKITLGLVGVAAAIGPVLVGLGTLTSTVLPMAISGFGALKTAVLALTSPWGLVVAAVGVLSVGLYSLYKTYNPTIQSAKELADVSKQVASATQGEIAKLKEAIAIAGNDKKSKEERVKALNQLKAQYPDYFGKMSIEKLKVGELKTAYDKLSVSILNAANARAQEENLQKLIRKHEEEKKAVVERRSEYKQLDKDSKQMTNTDLAMGVPVGTGTQSALDVAAKKLKNAKTQAEETRKSIENTVKSLVSLNTTKTDTVLDFSGLKGGSADESEAERRAKADAQFAEDQVRDWEKLKKIFLELKTTSIGTDYRRKEQEVFNKYYEKELEIRELNTSEAMKLIALDDVRIARQEELIRLRENELKLMKPTTLSHGFNGSDLGPNKQVLNSEFARVWGENMAKVGQGLEALDQKTAISQANIQNYIQSLGMWGGLISEKLMQSGTKFSELTQVQQMGLQGLAAVGTSLLGGLEQGFQSLFQTGKFSFKGLAQALTGLIAKLAAAATVAFILSNLIPGAGAASAATGAASGAAKAASGASPFVTILKSLMGFKTGGIADGPSSGYLALLHGREVITPYNQAEKMLSGGGGGPITVNVEVIQDRFGNWSSVQKQQSRNNLIGG